MSSRAPRCGVCDDGRWCHALSDLSHPPVTGERGRVEIDWRPQCRAAWLDRGELDKIIERSAAEPGGSPTPAAPPPPPSHPSAAPSPWGTQAQGNQGCGRDCYHHGHGKPPRRRTSVLKELFD